MAAEVLVEFIQQNDVRIGKNRRQTGRLQHIHKDQVLSVKQFNVAHKTFSHERIVKRGEEHQQCASAQTQTKERAKLIKIGRDDTGLERVERVAAGAVMDL